MKTGIIKALLLSIVAISGVWAESLLPKEIVLATTDWLPYTKGISGDQKGIVCEYVDLILAKNNIKLTIRHFPWTRAIDLANHGKVNGLLTAVKSEAPDLHFTDVPIMKYEISFFVRKDSEFPYDVPDFLHETNYILGAIQDYGYGSPVDEFIKAPANRRRVKLLTGSNGIKRLIELLKFKRIDVFVGEKLGVEATIKKHSVEYDFIKNVGSLPSNPFYLALNPKWRFSKSVKALLDKEFAGKENKQLLESIIKKYVSSSKPSKVEGIKNKKE